MSMTKWTILRIVAPSTCEADVTEVFFIVTRGVSKSSLIAEVILALVAVSEAKGEQHQAEEDDKFHMISCLILLVSPLRGLIYPHPALVLEL